MPATRTFAGKVGRQSRGFVQNGTLVELGLLTACSTFTNGNEANRRTVTQRIRFPILIWWRLELVMLYNDAYRPILGETKHPKAMGQQIIWNWLSNAVKFTPQEGRAAIPDSFIRKNVYIPSRLSA